MGIRLVGHSSSSSSSSAVRRPGGLWWRWTAARLRQTPADPPSPTPPTPLSSSQARGWSGEAVWSLASGSLLTCQTNPVMFMMGYFCYCGNLRHPPLDPHDTRQAPCLSRSRPLPPHTSCHPQAPRYWPRSCTSSLQRSILQPRSHPAFQHPADFVSLQGSELQRNF